MKDNKKFIALGMILYLTALVAILAGSFTVSMASGMFASSWVNREAITWLDEKFAAVSSFPQQEPEGDKLVLGGAYTLKSGDTLNGNLFILGGTANLEEDSLTKGDVVVLGGSLTANGTIEGMVGSVGGLVNLGSTAVVEGDVATLAGHLNQDEGASIEGEVTTDIARPFALVLPGSFRFPNWEGAPSLTFPKDFPAPTIDVRVNPIWDGFWWLIRSLIWAGLAILVALFAPQRMERAGRTAANHAIVSGGLGCLTILIVPLILFLLALTICGIPISFLGVFLLWIAWCFGLIILGMETGKRLMSLFKADWAVPVSAGIGTFVLTLVVNGLGTVLPCIGWMVPAVVGLIGFGAVILSRFGAHVYPQEASLDDIGRSTEDPIASAQMAGERPVDLINPAENNDVEGPEGGI